MIGCKSNVELVYARQMDRNEQSHIVLIIPPVSDFHSPTIPFIRTSPSPTTLPLVPHANKFPPSDAAPIAPGETQQTDCTSPSVVWDHTLLPPFSAVKAGSANVAEEEMVGVEVGVACDVVAREETWTVESYPPETRCVCEGEKARSETGPE